MRLLFRLYPFAHFCLRIYWRFSRPLTAGARVVVIDEKDRVLLVRHTYMSGWYLPGGGVDRGETMRRAAERELWEEVGVTPKGDLHFFGLYANFAEFKSDHVSLFVLRSFDIEVQPNREIAEFGFFARDALPIETSKATRVRIHEVMEGLAPPDHWAVD
ncbi:MAG: DNA mismatch repair protein MutT [Parvibaculum sp.]|jgi:8-oxo-dGTP pyrophosphatase MutT (NUDIX family)|nr:DNA mismatch repair protein MutT [Parvibaculum sp.]|tara:strand:- start:6827 stop:7303 length:477 start_codon:yes stop_codon:yes gene_type:complete